MTAKEHLQSVYSIQQKIRRLQNRREDLRADLYSIGSPTGQLDSERVQTSISGDRMAELVARVDEAERDIVAELKDLIVAKDKISQEIERVPNENYKQLLFDRYILCLKWEKIALDRDKGIRWIYRMHGKALNSFEKVWNSH